MTSESEVDSLFFPCVGGISNTTVPFNTPQFDTEMLRKLEMDFDAFCLEEARKKKFEERKKARFLCVRGVVGARKKRRGGKRGVPSSVPLPFFLLLLLPYFNSLREKRGAGGGK